MYLTLAACVEPTRLVPVLVGVIAVGFVARQVIGFSAAKRSRSRRDCRRISLSGYRPRELCCGPNSIELCCLAESTAKCFSLAPFALDWPSP